MVLPRIRSRGSLGYAVAIAAVLASGPAQAQGVFRVLEEIGTSPAAAEALERLAANSELLATALRELGIEAAPEASALEQLNAEQRGAAIVNSQTLAHLWVTAPSSDLATVERRLATINTLRSDALGQGRSAGQIETATKGTDPPSFLSIDLGNGDAGLRTPLFLMNKGAVTLKLQKFNLYKSGGVAATAACGTSAQCLAAIGSLLERDTRPKLVQAPRVSLGQIRDFPLIRTWPTPP